MILNNSNYECVVGDIEIIDIKKWLLQKK
jgi:hypothetical protein